MKGRTMIFFSLPLSLSPLVTIGIVSNNIKKITRNKLRCILLFLLPPLIEELFIVLVREILSFLRFLLFITLKFIIKTLLSDNYS